MLKNFSTLKVKFRISARPCNILYVIDAYCLAFYRIKFVIFQASFEVLIPDFLDAVYDLTIAYSNAYESHVPRAPAPSMTGE